jgi:hypothetical protein
MKKIAVIICVFFVSQQLKGQSIEDIRVENKSEIETLKKEYFKNLQEDQDARIFSITQQRENYIYKKQNSFDLKVDRYNDSIANAIGFRRVSKAIEDQEKKRKAEELKAANKREAFYRSQSLILKKDDCENDLKSKLNFRHEKLKERYAVEK